jgi:succinate dehydrogenase/fumarate reductase cytochrome b subunit
MRFREAQMRQYSSQQAAERAHERAVRAGFYYSGVCHGGGGIWLLFVTARRFES